MAIGEVFVSQLRCELTAEEHKRKAEALASGVAELVTLEEGKKAAAKHWQEQIEEQRRANNVLAYDVRTGTESRPVECTERPRFKDMHVDGIRLDMPEGDPRAVVTSRAMLPHERQLELIAETPEEGEEPDTEEPNPLAKFRH